MDAAAAAAMSDPERNPAFRRRWRDAPYAPREMPPQDLGPEAAVEQTGRELLEHWRRDRVRRPEPPP